MQVHSIPYRDAFIVYRPLARIAFAANAPMVQRAQAVAAGEPQPDDDAQRFLASIGFLQPDPPPPDDNPVAAAFAPTTAVCLLTQACNLRCVYCYAAAGEGAAQPELPEATGRRAIDLVHANAHARGKQGFAVAFHGGGEPTLAGSSFRALVEHARSKDLPCSISVASNGCWSPALREWIVRHLDEVSLSFDGTRALQDRQRPRVSGRSSFDAVMATIAALDRAGMAYGIRLTCTDQGLDELPTAIEFLCRESGCRTFQAEPAFAQGRAQERAGALSQHERFAAAFLRAHDIAARAGCHLYYSGARPWVLGDRFCQAIYDALIVAPDGGLTACYEVFGRAHPLAGQFFFGTLGADGQAQVDDAARAQLFAGIAERRRRCRDCFCYWHCAGDCPPKALSSPGGQADHASPRCELNRTLTRELLARAMADAGGIWLGQTAGAPAGCEVAA